MVKIGLCGSSGSGKGYVCEEFKRHGFVCIDTDRVYATKIVASGSDCLNELCMFFGKDILNSDGTLNKKVLSTKVFEGENASQHLKVLNNITHRYIRCDVERTVEECVASGVKAVVIDAPVLFESGFDNMCDITVCVTAPYDLKMKRIMERDGIPYHKAQARLQSQLTDDKLRELCDYEIVNDGTSAIDVQIADFIKKFNVGE